MYTIKEGEASRRGLTKVDGPAPLPPSWILRIPVFVWFYKKRYEITTDSFHRGWVTKEIFIKVKFAFGNVELGKQAEVK